jgi:small conductance mechanosensitive channel
MSLGDALNLLTSKLVGWTRAVILQLPNLAVAVFVVVVFWLFARLVRNLTLRFLRRFSHSEQVNRLVSQTLYLAAVVTGAFVALGILGLQKTVASLLAGAGILGLALGFAFQDIAANFMAGIYLSIERPFRRGHLIKTKDWMGVVQEVTLRWNRQVFENPITNYTTPGKRRVDLKVGVSYDDDLEQVRQVALAAVDGIPGRVKDREAELFFEEVGESSINFVLRFWIDFQRQADFLRARSEAIERIKSAFADHGITMPFPTQTLDWAAKSGESPLKALAEAVAGSTARSSR